MAVTEPVKAGADLIAACSIPGTTTSMPNVAVPVLLALVSSRGSGLPISAKVLRVLERRRGIERQLGGVGRQRTIGQALAAGMDDEAFFGAAVGGGDFHRSAAARTSTPRAAAPAVRRRPYSTVVDIEAPSFWTGGSFLKAIL